MPTYEYKCEECSTKYDVYHKVKEIEDDVVCPKCESKKHTRLMSATMVSMGGSSSTYSISSESSHSCSSGSCCGGSCSVN